MNIYVGNISYNMKQEDLRSAFENYGHVSNAKIIVDKRTGRSKGYGFVEMENDAEGQAAIDALNNQDIAGRNVRVMQAHPKTQE